MSRLLLLIALFGISSCGNLSAHDNFKDHMSSNVGKKISDSNTLWVREDRYVSARLMKNGNVEHKYRLRNGCWYFFETDVNTEVIIGWRFEGSEKDCVISL
jgi:hypothetical protein